VVEVLLKSKLSSRVSLFGQKFVAFFDLGKALSGAKQQQYSNANWSEVHLFFNKDKYKLQSKRIF
jgi:hypothetical protein